MIKRAVEKAKGGDADNYSEARYEGFGPTGSTVIVDCLTDNTNRSITDVKTCFNKCKGFKMVNAGSASYTYESVGLFVFPFEDEEAMLDAMMEGDVDVLDINLEDGMMTVKTSFTDFGKAHEVFEEKFSNLEFETCEATWIPNEYVILTEQEDIDAYHKLMDMLNEVDDVDKVYSNVLVKGE